MTAKKTTSPRRIGCEAGVSMVESSVEQLPPASGVIPQAGQRSVSVLSERSSPQVAGCARSCALHDQMA